MIEPHWRKIAQLRQRHILIPGQMQKRVQHHRGMTVRQNNAVAVWPVGVGRIKLEMIAVKRGRGIGHAHRRARVPGLRSLYRVDR